MKVNDPRTLGTMMLRIVDHDKPRKVLASGLSPGWWGRFGSL